MDGLNALAWGRTVEEAVSNAQKIVPGLEKWLKTHLFSFQAKVRPKTLRVELV
jgi:hypothetical protein